MSWGRMVRQLVVPRGSLTSRGLAGAMMLAVVALLGGTFAGDPAALNAREYSAYADPEKPVISFLLSEEADVQDFR